MMKIEEVFEDEKFFRIVVGAEEVYFQFQYYIFNDEFDLWQVPKPDVKEITSKAILIEKGRYRCYRVAPLHHEKILRRIFQKSKKAKKMITARLLI